MITRAVFVLLLRRGVYVFACLPTFYSITIIIIVRPSGGQAADFRLGQYSSGPHR